MRDRYARNVEAGPYACSPQMHAGRFSVAEPTGANRGETQGKTLGASGGLLEALGGDRHMYIPNAARLKETFKAAEDLRVQDVVSLAALLIPRVVGANALRAQSYEDV